MNLIIITFKYFILKFKIFKYLNFFKTLSFFVKKKDDNLAMGADTLLVLHVEVKYTNILCWDVTYVSFMTTCNVCIVYTIL